MSRIGDAMKRAGAGGEAAPFSEVVLDPLVAAAPIAPRRKR